MGCINISKINLSFNTLVFLIFICISGFLAFNAFLTAKENFTNFNTCRARGFSKEFCVQTPNAVSFPGSCRCPDGSLGRYLVGWRGQCICDAPRVIY